jgi:uncharacterized protein (TIGR03382 family)
VHRNLSLSTLALLSLTVACGDVSAPTATDGHAVAATVRTALIRAGVVGRLRGASALPSHASSPVVVSSGGVTMSARPSGARAVPALTTDGVAVHVDAVDGAHLVRTSIAAGVEDLLVIDDGAPRSVAWNVSLDGVAGLRLVGRTLEALDGGGAPRVRMEAPYAIDAVGLRVPLDVAVRGCAVSTDPAPPWGRPVVPPGAASCEIVISWREALAAPAVIDPAWTTTGSMSTGRALHAAAKVAGNRVLVVGGTDTSAIDPLASAELYDVASGTFAVTGPMSVPRLWHAASALADGRALVTGGSSTGAAMDGSGVVDSGEVFDPATGTWSPPVHMASQRRFHTSTLLDGGRVLVAGGLDSMASQIGTADVFDPKTGAFSPVPGGLHVPRRWHTATKRKDGTVLLVGGDTTQFAGVAGTELYDPAKNAFTDGPPLGAARKRHVAAMTPDGSVVVLAGSDGEGKFVLGGEVVDPKLSAWKPLPGAYQARVETAGDVIGGGYVLVVAGFSPSPGQTTGTKDWTASTELYRPETMSFVQGPSLAVARSNHTVTVLDDGRVLVTGGDEGPLSSAEIYAGGALGGACSAALDCTSGFCVDGVCCDGACTGQCESCDGAKKGTCSPVTGTPHGARPVCGGSATCAGACDGKSGAACTFPDPKTPCASSCDAAKGTAAVAFCDGQGTCGSPNPIACSPYACGDKACKTTCATAADCATGFVCTGGKCVPPATMCVDDHTTQVNGAAVDCTPYKCSTDGTCREACTSSADCVSGFTCGSSGRCVRPAAPAATDGSSGGCSTTSKPASNAAPWLALAAALLARRRRRNPLIRQLPMNVRPMSSHVGSVTMSSGRPSRQKTTVFWRYVLPKAIASSRSMPCASHAGSRHSPSGSSS